MKRKIIFICGHPGSGKTTFSKNLSNQLMGVETFISHDLYLKHSSKERKKYFEYKVNKITPPSSNVEEDPKKWYDNAAFLKDLNTLKLNGALNIKNAWNQKSGEKDLKININLKNKKFIICEGMYLLHKIISKHADMTIYLNTSWQESLKRQESRDSHRTSKESRRYKKYLAKEYSVPYFKKNRKFADIIVNIKNNKETTAKKISKYISDKL